MQKAFLLQFKNFKNHSKNKKIYQKFKLTTIFLETKATIQDYEIKSQRRQRLVQKNLFICYICCKLSTFISLTAPLNIFDYIHGEQRIDIFSNYNFSKTRINHPVF